MYKSGKGVKKDLRLAASLYKQACDNGEPNGCNNLGVLYKNGLGVTKDKDRAVELFKQACNEGNTRGCDNLKDLN